MAIDTKKSICVVLDATEWRSTFLLRSTAGSILLEAVRKMGGVIALLEIVETEATKHVAKAAMEAANKIRSSAGTLNIATGLAYNFELPTESAVKEQIHARFNELEPFLKRVPLKAEHALGAAKRVIEETPPNGPDDQQFKDSVNWEAALELSHSHAVHFVTGDTGFFEQNLKKEGDGTKKSTGKVVARNILDDIKKLGTDIHVHYKLESYLKTLESVTPTLDYERLKTDIGYRIFDAVRRAADGYHLIVINSPTGTVAAFPTDKPDIQTLTFEIQYPVTDMTRGPYSGRVGPDGTAEVTGTAPYNVKTQTISPAVPEINVELFWVDVLGRPRKERATVVSAVYKIPTEHFKMVGHKPDTVVNEAKSGESEATHDHKG